MKKLFIAIVALFSASTAVYADTSLESAFDQLSALPGMVEQNIGTVKISDDASLRNVKTYSVTVGEGDISSYRDKFVWMTENLPVRNMVIGANNRRELAAVYATPTAGGDYSVLIFKGNSIDGNFSVSYGQTTPAGIARINSADLVMDNAEIVLTCDNDSFLSVTAY